MDLPVEFKRDNVNGSLQDDVRKHGIVGFDKECGIDLDQLTQALGERLSDTQIRIKNESTKVVNQPDSIPFHCDYPKAEFIVWQCVSTGKTRVPLLIKDGVSPIQKMSDVERNILGTIMLVYKCTVVRQLLMSPLVYANSIRKINTTYNPWSIQRNISEEQKAAVTLYKHNLKEELTIEANLNEGDFLVIDNRRMVHARARLDEDSNRFLIRRTIVGDAGFPPLEVVKAAP